MAILTWAQMTIDMARLVASSKAFVETLVFSSYLNICGQAPKSVFAMAWHP